MPYDKEVSIAHDSSLWVPETKHKRFGSFALVHIVNNMEFASLEWGLEQERALQQI